MQLKCLNKKFKVEQQNTKSEKNHNEKLKISFRAQQSILLNGNKNNFDNFDNAKYKNIKEPYFQKLDNLITKEIVDKTQCSYFETISIILLQIMGSQFVLNGYSKLKLNIMKSINELQSQKIIDKFAQKLDFKPSIFKMMHIFSANIKQIIKKLNNQRQNIKNVKNGKKEIQAQMFLEIHQIVQNQLNQSPQFLNLLIIFLNLILSLVKYPINEINKNFEKQTDQNKHINIKLKKEIVFIICDYLDCKIEQNSQQTLIENIYFIKVSQGKLQFGVKNMEIYNFFNSKKYQLQHQQTKSTLDLHCLNDQSTQLNWNSSSLKNQDKTRSINQFFRNNSSLSLKRRSNEGCKQFKIIQQIQLGQNAKILGNHSLKISLPKRDSNYFREKKGFNNVCEYHCLQCKKRNSLKIVRQQISVQLKYDIPKYMSRMSIQ